MTDKGTEEKKLSQQECDIEIFKMVGDHFNQDLREFWNRANFYLLTNAGLFSAFLIIYPTLLNGHFFLVALVPAVGISIATLWFLVLNSSLYWIDKWRQEMVRLSKEIDRFKCFATIESEVFEEKFKSPSYLTQIIPLIFLFAWIIILIFVALGKLYSTGGVWWILIWNSTVI